MAQAWTGVVLATMLAGCGGGPARSAVTDACAAISKATVGTVLRGSVSTAELSAVQADPDRADLFSQCTFGLTDGRLVVVGTGQSGTDVDVPALLGRFRKQVGDIDAAASDVAGVGQAALWVDTLGALYVFPGNGRWLAITTAQMGGGARLPPERVRADAIALAKAVGA